MLAHLKITCRTNCVSSSSRLWLWLNGSSLPVLTSFTFSIIFHLIIYYLSSIILLFNYFHSLLDGSSLPFFTYFTFSTIEYFWWRDIYHQNPYHLIFYQHYYWFDWNLGDKILREASVETRFPLIEKRLFVQFTN